MKTKPRSEAPHRVRNLPWHGVGLILLALASLAATPGTAQAHSELITSNPKDGATLKAAPATITFTFSEGIAPTYAVMTLRVGTREVATLETVVRDDRISAGIPPALHGNGDWRVAYRIVSADGHPVTGKVAFMVAAPATPTPTPAPTPTASSSGPSQTATPSGDPDADTDRDSGSSDDGGGVNPGFSVLVLALLVSAPVAAFVVIGNRKRREDQQNPS